MANNKLIGTLLFAISNLTYAYDISLITNNDFVNAIELDNPSIINFIDNNKDKYISEVSEISPNVKINTIIKSTYSFTLKENPSALTFDSDKNKGTINYLSLNPEFILSNDCKITSTYVGTNSFGVKKDITKKYCTYYEIKSNPLDSGTISDATFNLSPPQFRDLKKNSLNFDVFFIINGDNINKIVSENVISTFDATLDSLIDYTFDSHLSYVEILKINLKLPNKEPITIFKNSKLK